MTVPIYAWGLIWFLLVAWASDRYGMRGPFIAGPLVLLIIGYAILMSVESLGVRYFACYSKPQPLFSVKDPSNKRSNCDGHLPYNWNVHDVAERQRCTALQAGHYDRFIFDFRKHGRGCRRPDFHLC